MFIRIAKTWVDVFKNSWHNNIYWRKTTDMVEHVEENY